MILFKLMKAVCYFTEDATDHEQKGLIQELNMMKMTGDHININKLLGCCSQDGKSPFMFMV